MKANQRLFWVWVSFCKDSKAGASPQVLVLEQHRTIWESTEPVSPALASVSGSPQKEELPAEMPSSPSAGPRDGGKSLHIDADMSVYWAATNCPSDTLTCIIISFYNVPSKDRGKLS